MRTDITHTYEDFERIAEDYFELIPPDPESFDLDLCISWDYDEDYKLLIFKFDDEWDMDAFVEKVEDCAKYRETFDINDHFEGVNRETLTVTVEGKEGGLV